MKIAIVPVTPFQQNCSILIDEESRKAAVVDPGGEPERILEALERAGAALDKILVTHGHLDHCGATAELRRRTGVVVEGPHCEDEFLIGQLPESARRYGLESAETFVPDRWLQHGDAVQFGNVTLEVHHCPGHTPGHVVFFSPTHRLAMVGDVLFQGSIGRTDLPRGDAAALLRSITTRLWPLGDDVTFVPGHGPLSTFGEERRSNPFVADRVLAPR